MQILDIPQFFQAPDSYDCLLVCDQMVMSFFGVKSDITQMKEHMHYVPQVGTSLYENGTFLLEKGFQVTAITAQPQLFPPEVMAELGGVDHLADSSKVRTLIQKKIEKTNSDREKLVLNTFLEYLEKGGELHLEIPKFHHIQEVIDRGFPVIALMYAAAMGQKEGGFHGVVVAGYRGKELLINNPSEISSKQHWVSAQDFFYGLYASTCVDYDNGSLLVVGKS